MKKKLTAMLLIMSMVCTFLPVSAMAAEAEDCPGGEACSHVAAIGTTHYDSLQEAFKAVTAEEQTTITLLNSTTLEESITTDAKDNIVLDLNGCTITYEKEKSRPLTNYGTLKIMSSKENGQIVCTNPGGYGVVDNKSSGNLEIDGVTLVDVGIVNAGTVRNRKDAKLTVLNTTIQSKGKMTPNSSVPNAAIASNDGITVRNCNITSAGNGISIEGISSTKDVIIEKTNVVSIGSQISSPTEENIYYGGNIMNILSSPNGNFKINDCNFSATVPASEGHAPGIVVLGSGNSTLDVTNTTISTLFGESLLIQDSTGGPVKATFTDCTLTNAKGPALVLLGNTDSANDVNIHTVELAGNTTVSSSDTTPGSFGVELLRNSKLIVGEQATMDFPGQIGIFINNGDNSNGTIYNGSAMKASVTLLGTLNAAIGIYQDEDSTAKWNNESYDKNRGPISITLGENSVLNATEAGIVLAAKAQEATDEEIALATPKIEIAEDAVINAPQKVAKTETSATPDDVIEKLPVIKTLVTYVFDNGTANKEVRVEPGDVTLLDAPTRSGYSFVGWSDGQNTYPAGSTYSVGNDAVTFTAVWEANSTGGGTVVKRYDVTLADTDNGSITATHKRASKNSTVTITATPDEGYVVDAVTVTEKDGDKVEVTKKDDNKYTFKMPASDVTVKATFKVAPTEPEQPSGLPFTDVAKDAWYFPAVEYVFNNGLMNGTTATTFAPNVELNRAMMAAVLYNMEGGPACDKSGLFSDVADGKWYTDAVNWAASNNIVSGMPDGTYAPDQALTREQMASILYRYAEYKGIDVSARADLSTFTDGTTVSPWAQDVVQWAVAEKLMSGNGNELQPKGTASRAQVATVLMNYCENVAK